MTKSQHTKLPPFGELEDDYQDEKLWSKDQRRAAEILSKPRRWKDMPSITTECSTGSYYGAVANKVGSCGMKISVKKPQSFSEMPDDFVNNLVD